MPKRSLVDPLDRLVDALLGRSNAVPPDPDLAPLARIAEALRHLPRENFKARLKSDLERKSSMASPSETVSALRQTATASLRIKGVAAAIEFYTKAFGAREIMRFEVGGQVAHAKIAIGNSVVNLGEESLDHGFPSAITLGGSPVMIQLFVENADAQVQQAVAAGARIVRPVTDQFYGDRSGHVADPFGYTWNIATRKEDMSVDEVYRRFREMTGSQQPESSPAARFIPEGFHTVTPYLRAQNVNALIDFAKQTFGAEETARTSHHGEIHANVRVGDSMVFIGGGAPELSVTVTDRPMALHVYVEDTDATYERGLKAGGVSLGEPVDHPYGERGAGVKDPAGNYWYIATYKGARYIPEGLHTVTPYLHPRRAEPFIQFVKRAFGGDEVAKYASPDGVIQHASVRIGDSIVEMGEAHGPYQPMETAFYLYVPDVDAMYHRAVGAGGTSMTEPADQPYGDRIAVVKDTFGNQWVLATHIRDL
jgi:PhnB protein